MSNLLLSDFFWEYGLGYAVVIGGLLSISALGLFIYLFIFRKKHSDKIPSKKLAITYWSVFVTSIIFAIVWLIIWSVWYEPDSSKIYYYWTQWQAYFYLIELPILLVYMLSIFILQYLRNALTLSSPPFQ